MSRVTDVLGKIFTGSFLDLAQKLSGEDGDMWYVALKRFLRKENPWPKVWKTIQLGTHSSIADMRRALDAGFRIGEWASRILEKVALATKQESVDLVIPSVAELGFSECATIEQIYEAALKRGYQLCPAEVGPQFRLQYADQPMGERLIIAMEPITDSGGYRRVFYVGRGGYGLWLYSDCGDPDSCYGPECRFVFRRQ